MGNSTAFGFSITATATFGALSTLRGQPSLFEVFLFVLGAALPFTALQAVATRGFRSLPAADRSEVVLLGTAFNVLSVALSMAASVVISYYLPYVIAWLLAPFAGVLVYVGAEAAELALAEARLDEHGGS